MTFLFRKKDYILIVSLVDFKLDLLLILRSVLDLAILMPKLICPKNVLSKLWLNKMHSFVNVCKIQTGGERYIKGLLWTVWPDGYIIFSISQFTAMKVCPMADGRPNLPDCSKLGH